MDVSKLSDEELRIFLSEHGIEGVEEMELLRDEMEGIALSLLPPDIVPASSLVSEVSHPSNPSNSSNPLYNDDILAQLQEATGYDAESAKHILEACGWDIGSALSLCMPENPERGGSSLFDEDGHGRGSKPSIDTSNDYEAIHGVRRPDAVKQLRLVDSPPGRSGIRRGGGNIGRGRASRQSLDRLATKTLGRAEDPSVEWLFPPPLHLSYPDSFDETKAVAQSESKWILANIQSASEFTSHVLNRDTWKNETIESLCRTSFLFWQRGNTSYDGREFMALYEITDNDLPWIAIIDPRTGALISRLTTYVDPMQLVAHLVEFLESNALSNGRAPVSRRFMGSTTANSLSSLAFSDRSRLRESELNDEDYFETIVDATERSSHEPTVTDILPPVAPKTVEPSSTALLPPTASNTSLVTEESPAKIDYGTIPREPGSDVATSSIARVSFRLPSGKAIVRKFSITESVKGLYAFAASVVANESNAGHDSKSTQISLFTAFPKRNIAESMTQSIGDAGLSGTQLTVQIC